MSTSKKQQLMARASRTIHEQYPTQSLENASYKTQDPLTHSEITDPSSLDRVSSVSIDV